MQIVRTGAVLLSVFTLACGDDGGPRLIDSGMGDSGPKACTTALSIGELDVNRENKTTGYMEWDADITGMLSDGNPIHVWFEFWPASMPTPIGPGTIDLAAAPNNDYQTCRLCIFAQGGTEEAPRYFFQRAGTVTLTEDALTTKNFKGTITGLVLEEVSVDDMAHSTPIPTGDCAIIPDKTVDEDRVPDAWMCAASAWYDGATCDCQCNFYDNDCFLANKPVTGCNANEACWVDATPTIVCIPQITAADDCTTAAVGTIALNTPVSGNTKGADRDYNIGNCTGYNEPGPDQVYKITLTEGVQYTVTLSNLPTDVDLGVGLIGPDTVNDGAICMGAMGSTTTPMAACVAGYDEGLDGANETFQYTVPVGKGGTYYVVVDSYGSFVAGTYTLTIQ